MFDLHLNESEFRLLSGTLEERLNLLLWELVHTDDRAMKRDLTRRLGELEALTRRVRETHASVAQVRNSTARHDYVTKPF